MKSMEESPDDVTVRTEKSGFRNYFVLAVSLAIVTTLLVIPFVRAAHERAQQTQSMNNLKCLALAVHNFHDTRKRFPAGAMLSDDNHPLHGWQSSIMPYIESNPLYTFVEMESRWDDPFNQHVYRQDYGCYASPRIDLVQTGDGYYLSHYSANQRLFHIGSRFRFSDLSAGASNVWLCSEIFDDFRPWGAPYNWHDLDFPPKRHAKAHGWSGGGMGLARADGSVDFLDDSTDLELVHRLRSNMPLPDRPLIDKPKNDSEFLSHKQGWQMESLVLKRADMHFVGAQIWKDRSQQVKTVFASSHHGKAIGRVTPSDLTRVVEQYPSVETLISNTWVNQDAVLALKKCSHLKHLKVGRLDLDQDEIPLMQELTTLKILSVVGEGDLKVKLKQLLPDCEIRVRENE